MHVCGGNPRRKRVYFTKYADLAPAFRRMKVDEVLLEHCTLSYDLMDLWRLWDFKGDLGLGVIDQRSDDIETIDVIAKRIEPALKHFPRERLILTSECGWAMPMRTAAARRSCRGLAHALTAIALWICGRPRPGLPKSTRAASNLPAVCAVPTQKIQVARVQSVPVCGAVSCSCFFSGECPRGPDPPLVLERRTPGLSFDGDAIITFIISDIVNREHYFLNY